MSTSSGVTGPRSDSQNYLPVALFISLAILFFRAVSAFSPANRAEERPTAIAAPPFSSPERLPGYRTAESARETSQRLEKWQQEQRRERQALQQRRLDELKRRTSPQRKAVDTEEPAIAEIPEPPRKDPARGDSVLRQLLELRGRMDQNLRRLEKKEASDEQGRSTF
ncbi:MAG: hypothetical protein IT428_08775 [Planctomycetaceae bacterium]|nr:hypothetical protein [Planctomycetaceae bacterium]